MTCYEISLKEFVWDKKKKILSAKLSQMNVDSLTKTYYNITTTECIRKIDPNIVLRIRSHVSNTYRDFVFVGTNSQQGLIWKPNTIVNNPIEIVIVYNDISETIGVFHD